MSIKYPIIIPYLRFFFFGCEGMRTRIEHVLRAFICPEGHDQHSRHKTASGFDFEAVLYETAIEKGAVSIGPTKARCATFCELDGVNEFRLFHFSGLEPEGPGLHSYLGHGHSVFCDFHCGHSLISTCNISEGPYRQ